MCELPHQKLVQKTFERFERGELVADRPFTFEPYEQPFISIDPDSIVTEPISNFFRTAKERPNEIAFVYAPPGTSPDAGTPGICNTRPRPSELIAKHAIDQLFKWHMNHVEHLNLLHQISNSSLYDLHLSTTFRRGEELYRVHFTDFPETDIATTDDNFLNARAKPSGDRFIVTLNHGVATLPFWLAALHRLPRPWNEKIGKDDHGLRGFVLITDFVLYGKCSDGIETFITELSETEELRRFATGYGGWYPNPNGSGILRRQDELESPGAEPLAHVRLTLETFLLCHELAHAALRHDKLFDDWGPRDRWSELQASASRAVLQQAEIQADALAVEMTTLMRPFSLPQTYLAYGIFARFILAEALVTYFLLLACGEPAYESPGKINERLHPLAATRMKCAIHHFAKWFFRNDADEARKLIDQSERWAGKFSELAQLVRARRSN